MSEKAYLLANSEIGDESSVAFDEAVSALDGKKRISVSPNAPVVKPEKGKIAPTETVKESVLPSGKTVPLEDADDFFKNTEPDAEPGTEPEE